MKYDLEERTLKFSENIIIFCKKVPKDIIIIPIVNQLIRCATSIGANYSEANGASSKKDFKNKIYICKKESKETMYWLKLMLLSLESKLLKNECLNLWKESKELTLIFSKITLSLNIVN